MEIKEICPCPNLDCPNHGDCEKCTSRHLRLIFYRCSLETSRYLDTYRKRGVFNRLCCIYHPSCRIKKAEKMIGAIAGDIIGAVYEHSPIKTKEFPFFASRCRITDGSVLTIAVADSILTGRSYFESIRDMGLRYPGAGYGSSFFRWLYHQDPTPYNSWGNGAAMRVSPVGFAFFSLDEVFFAGRPADDYRKLLRKAHRTGSEMKAIISTKIDASAETMWIELQKPGNT